MSTGYKFHPLTPVHNYVREEYSYPAHLSAVCETLPLCNLLYTWGVLFIPGDEISDLEKWLSDSKAEVCSLCLRKARKLLKK